MVEQFTRADLEARFPGLLSLLAVPPAETAQGGWLVALNKTPGGPESCARFRRSDAAALMPFASLLGKPH